MCRPKAPAIPQVDPAYIPPPPPPNNSAELDFKKKNTAAAALDKKRVGKQQLRVDRGIISPTGGSGLKINV